MPGIIHYLVDTEETGLQTGFHDLVEISLIRFDDRVQMTRIVKAKNPKNASFDALRITGKKMSDLYKGIECEQMINEVNEFLESDGLSPQHRCIVAHNASFDRRFIHHTWDAHNKTFPANLWLDTLALCRKITKRNGLIKPSLKLNDVCDLFGIKKFANAHSAAGDARNTFMLFKKFIDDNEGFIDLIKSIPHREEENVSFNNYEEENE
jgi:DNA polymerase III epsilon subunit-like protein